MACCNCPVYRRPLERSRATIFLKCEFFEDARSMLELIMQKDDNNHAAVSHPVMVIERFGKRADTEYRYGYDNRIRSCQPQVGFCSARCHLIALAIITSVFPDKHDL